MSPSPVAAFWFHIFVLSGCYLKRFHRTSRTYNKIKYAFFYLIITKQFKEIYLNNIYCFLFFWFKDLKSVRKCNISNEIGDMGKKSDSLQNTDQQTNFVFGEYSFFESQLVENNCISSTPTNNFVESFDHARHSELSDSINLLDSCREEKSGISKDGNISGM